MLNTIFFHAYFSCFVFFALLAGPWESLKLVCFLSMSSKISLYILDKTPYQIVLWKKVIAQFPGVPEKAI